MSALRKRNYIVNYGPFKTKIEAYNKQEAISRFKSHYPSAQDFYPDNLYISAENQPNNKQKFTF